MAITTAMCSSFKVEILKGLHDFTASTGNAFKIALYTSSATLAAATTAYSATNEVSGTGYTADNKALVNITPVISNTTTAVADFSDVSWTTATITARGALIYNSTNSNRAVCALDFGADKTSTAGTFTVVFPAPDDTHAIVRIN